MRAGFHIFPQGIADADVTVYTPELKAGLPISINYRSKIDANGIAQKPFEV